MPIIYRSIKGSELLSEEVDSNFSFLDSTKQDSLTFDSIPTNGSSNPVTSDGIFTSLSAYLKHNGEIPMSGNLNFNGNQATNIYQLTNVSGDDTVRILLDPSQLGLRRLNTNTNIGSTIDLTGEVQIELLGATNHYVKLTSNGFGIKTNSGGFLGSLNTNALTANRNIPFQDKNYTAVADIADIPSTSGLSNNSVLFWNSGFAQDNANFNYNGSRLSIGLTTASSSATTGALVVSGGVGIGGNLYSNGNVVITQANTSLNYSGALTYTMPTEVSTSGTYNSTNGIKITGTGTGATTHSIWSTTNGGLMVGVTNSPLLYLGNSGIYLGGGVTQTAASLYGIMVSFSGVTGALGMTSIRYNGSINAASGNYLISNIQAASFAPTSGSASLTLLSLTGTFNQTSTASGVISCVDVNPSISSITGTLYGLRSRIAASPTGGGAAWNLYADGTAPNWFGGDVMLESTKAIYLGNSTTNGTWRIIRSGNDLVFERRESGSYVNKWTVSA